jgi:MFS family permease
METSLETLFTTLAQVSFTVSGLMAVAIAGDSNRRDYWFGHKSRSFFVYINFLLLLLPGFISLSALITEINGRPSWTVSAILLGLLFGALSISFFFRKRKLSEPNEYKRLEGKFSKVNREMGLYSVALIFLGVFGYHSYDITLGIKTVYAELWTGILLVSMVITSSLNSVIFLQTNTETEGNKETETPFIEEKTEPTDKNDSIGINIIYSLFLAFAFFLIGIVIDRKK